MKRINLHFEWYIWYALLQYILTEYLCIKIIVFYITGSFASCFNSQTTNSPMHKASIGFLLYCSCQLFISLHVYPQVANFMQHGKGRSLIIFHSKHSLPHLRTQLHQFFFFKCCIINPSKGVIHMLNKQLFIS